jgi:hypothetical protein
MPPALTKKIAGVPTWGWLAAAVLAVGIGLYIRRKSVASSNTMASSSGPTSFDDLATSLGGGKTESASSGLDPALADLLSNATMAVAGQAQAASDAMMGGPYGYYDPGTYYDSSNGFETGATVNVAASGAGTTYSPLADVPTWSPHETPYNPSTGLVSDPWSGMSWSPGFATLTAAQVAAASGRGAAPLSAAAHPSPRPKPKPPPPSHPAAASTRSKPKAKAKAKTVGGWARVR